MKTQTYYWVVGVLLAALASLVSNLGLNLQKRLHQINMDQDDKVKTQYYKHNLWRIGLALVILGSLADVAALVFAPQSVIAPLGSLTLVSNTIFAPMLLREKITKCDVVATSLIVIGAAVAVSFGPHEDITYTVDELFSFYKRGPFIAYAFVVCVYMAILYVSIRKMELLESIDPHSPTYLKLRPYHRFAYASISGTLFECWNDV